MENKNYLAHHGTKGQRWGIRRWQNPDGSLTPAGREHYGYGDERDSSSKYDIKQLKAETKAKIRYEKAQQKMNAKLEKVKKAEKDRKAKERAAEAEKKAKEKAAEHAKEVAEQKKLLEAFKREHPLKYREIKKYLTKEGVLNDAGKALFFGNGEKKRVSDMSNRDLIESTNRMNLEANYKAATQRLDQMSPSAKKKFIKVLKNGGAQFAIGFGTSTLASLITSNNTTDLGKVFSTNAINALQSAWNSMGYTATSEFGLGQGNAFDLRTPEQRRQENIQREINSVISNAEYRSAVNSRVSALAAQAAASGNTELQRQYENYLNSQNKKKK
jgi:hypothetical protein